MIIQLFIHLSGMRIQHNNGNPHVTLLLQLCLFSLLSACSQLAFAQTIPASQPESKPVNVITPKTRFIALDKHGQPSTTAPICVRDTRSGLIWEVKSNHPGLRYRQNTYTWYSTDIRNNGGASGQKNGGHCTGSPCDTMGYVVAINQIKLCGLAHWRMPSRFELDSLVDYGIHYPGPMADLAMFPNTVAQYYWASSPDAYDKDRAWGIGFSYGFDYTYPKIDTAWLRLVHDAVSTGPSHQSDNSRTVSGNNKKHRLTSPGTSQCHPDIPETTPVNRFVINNNGTVNDRGTGLMWMRCALGQHWQGNHCIGQPIKITLPAARKAAARSHFAGFSDWQLPSLLELSKLSELRCADPALNPTLFPDAASVTTWTRTVFITDPRRQWQVEFHHGENLADLAGNRATVRLVRSVFNMEKPSRK